MSYRKEGEERTLHLLQQKAPELYSNVRTITRVFLDTYAAEGGGMTPVDKNGILTTQRSPDRMLGDLLEHIRLDPIPRYKAFKKALEGTGQGHVISRILEPTDDEPLLPVPIVREAARPNAPDLWMYDEGNLLEEVLPKYKNSIQNSIVKNADFDKAELWTLLQKYGVVDAETKETIKGLGTSRKMCDALLDKIRTVGQLRSLFIALVGTNQDYIVTNLGLNKNDFKEGARRQAAQPYQAVSVAPKTDPQPSTNLPQPSPYPPQPSPYPPQPSPYPPQPSPYPPQPSPYPPQPSPYPPQPSPYPPPQPSYPPYDLWVFKEGDELEIVLPGYKISIQKAIVSKADFDKVRLWNRLQKYEVVDKETKETIMALDTNQEMGDALFNKIMTVGNLCRLFVALVETNQGSIVTSLGFKENDFKEAAITLQREDPVASLFEPEDSTKQVTSLSARCKWMEEGMKVMRDESHGASPVIVALLDTGICEEHPDLKKAEIILDGQNFVEGEDADLRVDARGHGTHCAGIYWQYLKGVDVKILNLKVLNSDGNGCTKDILEGLKYIEKWENEKKKKVDIISMSVGDPRYSKEVEEVINHLALNKIIVCAASNSGRIEEDTILYPARYNAAIAIGSCDNLGKRCDISGVGKQLSFLFPGDKITSTSSAYTEENALYCEKSGTSMAAPHAGALAAVILAFIEKKFSIGMREKFTNSHMMTELLSGTCKGDPSHTRGYGKPVTRVLTKNWIEDFITQHRLM